MKLSLSNMIRLNETLSKEQGAAAKTFQKQQDELKQNFQALSEECGKLSGLNAELRKQLATADQTQVKPYIQYFGRLEASQNNIVHLDMKNSVFIEDILVE